MNAESVLRVATVHAAENSGPGRERRLGGLRVLADSGGTAGVQGGAVRTPLPVSERTRTPHVSNARLLRSLGSKLARTLCAGDDGLPHRPGGAD